MIPTRLNRTLTAAFVAYHGLVLFVLPLWLLPAHMAWAWALVPLAWLNSTHWGLIHEGIHKLLDADPVTNERESRLLSILMGPSFHVLRFGHLIHHKLNRDWHPETLKEPTLSAQMGYFANLLVGLYLTELVSSLLMAVLPQRAFSYLARNHFLAAYPEVATAGERFFYTRGNIRALREDMAATILLYAAAFWAYGHAWPVLLGFLALRTVVISVMDNVYHFETPLDNSKAGKELALPHHLSALMLHGNYHETHHLQPDVPWSELPAMHRAQGRVFDGAFLAHGIMQLRGASMAPEPQIFAEPAQALAA